MVVRFKKMNPNAEAPTRADNMSAGYDLKAMLPDANITIRPHETYMIDTGIACEIPCGFFGGVFARSGIAAKRGLRPSNCVGVIDASYRGMIKVALHNDTDEDRVVVNGERIAQLIILPYLAPYFVEVEELDETERGDGGFGHTGT